jgi:hypothetical protein
MKGNSGDPNPEEVLILTNMLMLNMLIRELLVASVIRSVEHPQSTKLLAADCAKRLWLVMGLESLLQLI